MRSTIYGVLVGLLLLGAAGCRGNMGSSDGRLRIVATTTMIADMARELGGDDVVVEGLMGPGVDPHLYKASEGDVIRIGKADLVLYHGLHLEGKMTEVLDQMNTVGITTLAIARAYEEKDLISLPSYPGNFDPHVWFDVTMWAQAASFVGEQLASIDSEHAAAHRARTETYVRRLTDLDAEVSQRIATLPPHQRVLVTAHDAFNYFGRAYGFEVHGLQGISTATEAGTADVQALALLVADRRVPALFVESSVPARSIEAVRAAVRDRGFDVEIGGNLFSDALGSPGTPEETYTGVVRHNVMTIVGALSREGGDPS